MDPLVATTIRMVQKLKRRDPALAARFLEDLRRGVAGLSKSQKVIL